MRIHGLHSHSYSFHSLQICQCFLKTTFTPPAIGPLALTHPQKWCLQAGDPGSGWDSGAFCFWSEWAVGRCGCRARWTLTSQAPASRSEQVEEAVLNPAAGHPHLHRFRRSPGQVQVSRFTWHTLRWLLPLSVSCPGMAGTLEPLESLPSSPSFEPD